LDRLVLKGALLAESLRLEAVLDLPAVTLTRVVRRDVSGSATSSQPSTWTFLEFEAADEVADQLAEALAGSLLAEGGWYASFTVGDEHVVVFAGRIFRHRSGDTARRAEAQAYARQVGVPEHQMDWGD
jgi:hypothetical protein